MVDLISVVTGGITITHGVLQFLEYLKGVRDTNIISAFFGWDGIRIDGSEIIEIEKHLIQDQDDVWWFCVKEVPEYTFIRLPVIESCVDELAGLVEGEKNPDARYWRWIAKVRQGVIIGGQYIPPNIKVDFLVIGYRPKALINHFPAR